MSQIMKWKNYEHGRMRYGNTPLFFRKYGNEKFTIRIKT